MICFRSFVWSTLICLFGVSLSNRVLLAQAKTESCNTGILPPGDKDTDLEVHGLECKVDAGTHVYRNVNIWGGGKLRFLDKPIDFHAHSILVESGGTLEAGSDAPLVGPLSIWLYGSKDDGIPSITCQSGPTCGVPEKVWDSNPLVADNVSMGTMKMPTTPCTKASIADPTTPTPAGDDCFYQYEIFDQGDAKGAFFGRKVLAVSYNGTINLRGAKGIRGGAIDANPADSGTSWVRLTDTIGKDSPSFHIDRAVPTWGPGDQIVLTSTDYLPSHNEQVEIAEVSSDPEGTKITLKSPTQFPHNGEAYDFSEVPKDTGPAPDPDGPNQGNPKLDRHLETRAAVALLTRSILIASEGRDPVLDGRKVDHLPADSYDGGHTVVRDGVKSYRVQGVEFYQLGQGGNIGKYPVHFHMARKVPQPTVAEPEIATYFADNSIHDSMTRFITIHATQGLLISRNVGYKSIGHGFYLEDATEINNRLYSNIGILARAAVVGESMNPRNVPGILSAQRDIGRFARSTDYDAPSLFWIMNTWNDFRYNVAVGAGTCGVCYWMPPAMNSGYSLYETWDSYASMQKNLVNAGATPLMHFVGNSCSTAMTAIQTVGAVGSCNGVDPPGTENAGKLHAIPNPQVIPDSSYPSVGAGQKAKAKICDAARQEDCSKVPACEGDGEDPEKPGLTFCAATTIDHFTTSFNWAQKNFSAIWLRGWWYLLRDSAITDVQAGGLSMVTGGGYTRSDTAEGFWSLSQRNLFVGNTQKIAAGDLVPANPAASNAGPFNPYALHCRYDTSFCVSEDDGISFQLETFNAQRLLNIYDGPSFEDSDAFADIHTTTISTLEECKPDNNVPGSCSGLKWSAAYNSGVLQAPDPINPRKINCVLPNAAIAWKQPNGFYYPPAFNSRNLSFTNVDIRHFVVQPLWQPKSFIQDATAVKDTYCSWEPGMFTNFTDVDRQTELTDLDGSLTGLLSQTTQSAAKEPSISITNDPFFVAPLETPECKSNVPNLSGTVVTSPYEYTTTVVYPVCATDATRCGTNWGRDCARQACYGVPLYRQTLTDQEYSAWENDPTHTDRPSIRMMGQDIFQRSNLTLNHANYYIDTTLTPADQPTPIKNVFAPGGQYLLFFVYAKPSLRQKYSLYIGKVDEAAGRASIIPGRINAARSPYTFTEGGDWIKDETYSPTTGLLEFTVDLSGQQTDFEKDRSNFCQPKSYCSYKEGENGKPGECGCAPGSACIDNSVCGWGVKDIECPTTGCYGLQLTLPSSFEAQSQPDLPPKPIRFADLAGQGDSYFKNVSFHNVDKPIAGDCHYDNPPQAAREP